MYVVLVEDFENDRARLKTFLRSSYAAMNNEPDALYLSIACPSAPPSRYFMKRANRCSLAPTHKDRPRTEVTLDFYVNARRGKTGLPYGYPCS